MVLKDILSISGEGGLFRFVAQGKNSVIVEHLETGKRSSAFASAKVSALEDISVFTAEGDRQLSVLFDAIHEKHKGEACPVKLSDNKALKAYFEEILPEYDRERVYVSDMKKILSWYNLLQRLDLLVPGEPEEKKAEEALEGEIESKPQPKPKAKLKSPAKPGVTPNLKPKPKTRTQGK